MKTLVVEDDFTSRCLMQRLLSPYGICDVAVNGREAVEAYRRSLESGARYDLLCLDIQMPEMDGHAVLREVHALQEKAGLFMFDKTRIVMTTVLDDSEDVLEAFRSQCDAYLLKPIDGDKLVTCLKDLKLIDDDRPRRAAS